MGEQGVHGQVLQLEADDPLIGSQAQPLEGLDSR